MEPGNFSCVVLLLLLLLYPKALRSVVLTSDGDVIRFYMFIMEQLNPKFKGKDASFGQIASLLCAGVQEVSHNAS